MTTGWAEHDGGPLEAGAAARAEREAFVLKVNDTLQRLVRIGYFSWEVEGAQHVPREGPVVFAQNHAGWFALDTLFVGGSVAQAVGVSRTPYFAAHDAALAAPVVGPFLRRLGGLPVSWFRHPERLPRHIQSYGICPEGVSGNCKPFWQAYRMREWSRGFVSLAMSLGAPIVPVAVLGGEESLPVAWTVTALEPLIGSVVGLPVAPVPLPARWKIIFHEPVHVGAPGRRGRSQHCAEIARRVQGVVQASLDREARRPPLATLASSVAAASTRLAARLAAPPVDELDPSWDPLYDDAPAADPVVQLQRRAS